MKTQSKQIITILLLFTLFNLGYLLKKKQSPNPQPTPSNKKNTPPLEDNLLWLLQKKLFHIPLPNNLPTQQLLTYIQPHLQKHHIPLPPKPTLKEIQKNKIWQLQTSNQTYTLKKVQKNNQTLLYIYTLSLSWQVIAILILTFGPIPLGLICLILLLLRWANDQPIQPQTPPTSPPPRDFLPILATILFFFTSQIYLASLLTYLQLPTHTYTLLLSSLSSLSTFAFTLLYFHYLLHQPLSQLGLRPLQQPHHIPYAIALYLISYPLLLASIYLSQWIANLYQIKFVQHPIVEMAQHGQTLWLISLVLLACVIAPLAEELFFRALLFSTLKQYIPKPAAIILSAAFFASLHPGFHSLLPIFLLGMLLAYLYEKTQSLWTVAIVHSLHNSLMMAKLLLLRSILQ